MGTYGFKDADNYGAQGNGSFFALKNDKDTTLVRFMYNDINDVEGHAVHRVQVGDKERYVNCLRAYNEPVDKCPFCAARMKVYAKLFCFVYDVDADEVKIWDRGKTFFSKLSSLCSRYNPLVGTVFEIERNGKKGDTGTTYETYATETDETTLDDLPELPVILGGLVLDKTAEEMEYYLDTGDFPMDEEDAPPSRNPAKDRRSSGASKSSAPTRRRPSASEQGDEVDEPPFDADAEEEKPARRASSGSGRRSSARGGRF